MKEYLIIDGYNVINAWPTLYTTAQKNLEDARSRLIEMMAEYQSYKGIRVIIVFDAHLVKKSMQKSEKQLGVEVVYTKEKETADSYIERLILELSRKNRVVVATNDLREQQMVLGGGATRTSVRELIIDYNNVKERINKRIDDLKIQKVDLSNRMSDEILEKLEKFRRKL